MPTTLYGKVKNKTNKKGRMIEKNDYDLLYLNEKEETYYRVHDCCSSIIDLVIVINSLSLEITRNNECDLKRSDHFPIVKKIKEKNRDET